MYSSGGDEAIEEGIILDLKDLVEQYMPNYQAARTASEYRMLIPLPTKEPCHTFAHCLTRIRAALPMVVRLFVRMCWISWAWTCLDVRRLA